MAHVEIRTYPVQMDHVEIEIYPVQMAPLLTPSVQSPITPNQYNLLRNEEAPMLIKPKCTESYYTKPV